MMSDISDYDVILDNLHDVDVQDTDDGGGPDGRHQEPIIYSRVSQVDHQKVVRSLNIL